MIQSIVAWSLKNRLIVILGALGLVGVGLHSAKDSPANGTSARVVRLMSGS
jgi:Cu/Ag efflux pump CusA